MGEELNLRYSKSQCMFSRRKIRLDEFAQYRSEAAASIGNWQVVCSNPRADSFFSRMIDTSSGRNVVNKARVNAG